MSQWHLSRQHLSRSHLSISGISQLLLPWFWWNFKGSILGTSRPDLTIKLTLSMKHLSWRHLSISGISQLLLTRFGWNFKCSFLGKSWTESNYQVDICPGNIYLWPNFEGRFQNFLFFRTRSFYPKFLYPKFVGLKIFSYPKFFWTQSFFGSKIVCKLDGH